MENYKFITCQDDLEKIVIPGYIRKVFKEDNIHDVNFVNRAFNIGRAKRAREEEK